MDPLLPELESTVDSKALSGTPPNPESPTRPLCGSL